jgi:hypothetical protein
MILHLVTILMRSKSSDARDLKGTQTIGYLKQQIPNMVLWKDLHGYYPSRDPRVFLYLFYRQEEKRL